MTVLSRRNFAKISAVGMATLSWAGLLTSCSQDDVTESSGGEVSGDLPNQVIVSMSLSSEPTAGFDPLVSWGCGGHMHEPLIQSTLITTNANMEFEYDVATAYSVTEDGLTWTFDLRNDVSFSDGMPLTARDVVFTIQGILSTPASECDLTMVDFAEAPNDTTVIIHLKKPFNALLYTLAVMGIVPAHAYDDNYGSNPIGSGRYVLEQWDRGQQVILSANPTYYGKAPQMQRVVVVFMEEDASLAGAQSGQIDVAYTSATFAGNQPQSYELLSCASVDSRGVSLPVGIPSDKVVRADVEYEAGNVVTSDLAIRHAINYGVDRDLLIKNVLDGYGSVAYGVCDGMPWSSNDMKCSTDIAYAQKLLQEAGWIQGSDGVREKEGVRASFDLYYYVGDTVRQALAVEFSNQMSSLGIEVSVKGASWDDIYVQQFSNPVLWGWGSNSPLEVYNLHYSAGSANYALYENNQVDTYFDEALAQVHVEDSYELYQKAQWDGSVGFAPEGDAPWVWFANIEHLYFVKEGLMIAEQKLHPHGQGWSLVNNIDAWSWS